MEKVKKQGMESLFCPYELALELKELGFDEISLFCYTTAYEGNPLLHCPHLLLNSQLEGFENEPISAPLWQQAFDWFRDKYNLVSEIFHNPEYEWKNWKYRFYWTTERLRLSNISDGHYETYEEARLECLKKLIEIAKGQNIK